MTDTLVREAEQSVVAKKMPRWLYAIVFAAIGLIAGVAGALLTHAAFPAQAGAEGPAGAAGKPGPAGLEGADGTGATLSTDKVGFCWKVNYQYGGNDTWADEVYLTQPTYTNGALSCDTGQFLSLTPLGPDGRPVKHYDVTAKEAP